MSNSIPVIDYENIQICDDENIQQLAGFYSKGLQLVKYLKDNGFEV